jgi:hypothetical protein
MSVSTLVHVRVHVACSCIYLYVVRFRSVLPNFLTKFRRNKTKYDLGKTKCQRNFADISFRDETDKSGFVFGSAFDSV